MPPEGEYFRPEDDALELHSIATKLHRWAERECSEDLCCPDCKGDGQVWKNARNGLSHRIACKRCDRTGSRLGKRTKLNEDRAVAIAARYGLRVYFQGDCRGCPLYLIPNEETRPDDSHYSSTGVAVCWLG